MTDAEMSQIYLDNAIRHSAQDFSRIARMFRDCADQMDKAAKRIRDELPPTEYRHTREDVSTSAINDIENTLRNINFSTMARYASQLGHAERLVDEAAKQATAE